MIDSSRRVLVFGVVVAALPGAGAAAPRLHSVVIAKMAFGPAPRGLRVGDTIEWVNKDIFRHTATAKGGAFDLDLPANGRGRTLIRAPGQILVTCRYHPGMKMQLVVGS
jgi:plastocyanin